MFVLDLLFQSFHNTSYGSLGIYCRILLIYIVYMENDNRDNRFLNSHKYLGQCLLKDHFHHKLDAHLLNNQIKLQIVID